MHRFAPLPFLAAVLITAAARPSLAAVKTETVEYRDGDQVCEGTLAWDDSFHGKRPGMVVVHDWMGVGDYVNRRAREVAALGYVAFAADIYGKGIRPKNAQEAGQLAGKFKGDLPLLRSRARAAFDLLAKKENVDPSRIFAMGYCFGGTTALELALLVAPRGLVTEVVLHVAAGLAEIRIVLIAEFVEEDLEGLLEKVCQDVQATTVGHTKNDFLHTCTRGPEEDF